MSFYHSQNSLDKGQRMEDQNLGRWLRERCRREHLSLRQAAAKTGLSHVTIADIIKDGRPLPETIKKLAHGFGGDSALQDHLLLLSGYRTQRPEGEELTESMAELMDKVSKFSEQQTRMMVHFADFLAEIEGK